MLWNVSLIGNYIGFTSGERMPKQKTKKCAAKRFKKTGTGKYLHYKAGARHLKRKKNAKRNRRLRQSGLVKSADAGRLKNLGL